MSVRGWVYCSLCVLHTCKHVWKAPEVLPVLACKGYCIGSCDSAQVHTLCVALAYVTVDVHVVHCIGSCDSRCTRCAL